MHGAWLNADRLHREAAERRSSTPQLLQVLKEPYESDAGTSVLVAAVKPVPLAVPTDITVRLRLVVVVEHIGHFPGWQLPSPQ